MSLDPPNALQMRRLQEARNVFEIDSGLRKIVAAKQVDETVIKVLKDKIAAGYSPKDSLLTDLFLCTKDVDLYEIIRQRLCTLDWYYLCKLYEAQIADPQIESILSEKVYKVALNSADYSRRAITEAMKSVGTTGVLNTLKSIEEEISDRAISGAAFGGNLPIPERVMIKSDVEFYSLVKEAMAEIIRRGTPPLAQSVHLTPTSSEELVSDNQASFAIIRAAVASGESQTVEFKETFSLNVKSGSKEKDKKIQHSALKNIAGFLNSKGGVLLIGITDSGNVVGIDREIQLFHQGSKDRFLLNFVNELKSKFGQDVFVNLKYDLTEIDSVPVLVCHCSPSQQECFLGESHEFWVRVNPATLQLEGREMMNYIKTRFHSQM